MPSAAAWSLTVWVAELVYAEIAFSAPVTASDNEGTGVGTVLIVDSFLIGVSCQGPRPWRRLQMDRAEDNSANYSGGNDRRVGDRSGCRWLGSCPGRALSSAGRQRV